MLVVGDQIGDWIVDAQLGEGGMGAVFRCHNVLSSAMKAAVKVLKAHEVGRGRERFAQELQSLATLSHPGIVRVLGGGEDKERGLLFLVMELLTGETLGDRIARGPLPPAEAVPLFRSVAESLAFAHASGIFHRDVKPANLMLVGGEGPKLIDFGIAKATEGAQLTVDGAVTGTLAYLAPELFRVDNADPAQCDVYALGLTLHEALTGQNPFPMSQTSGAQLGRVVGIKLESKPLDPGTGFSAELRELVLEVTHPDPAKRTPGMARVAAALSALAVDPLSQPWGARPASPAPVRPPETVSVRRAEAAPPVAPRPEVKAVAPPPVRPPTTDPVPSAASKGRAWMWIGAALVALLLFGGVGAAAVATGALALLWPSSEPTRPLTLTVEPVDAIVWVDGVQAELVGGSVTVDRTAGPVALRAAVGPGAAEWTGGACLPCTSCIEETIAVAAGEGAQPAALKLPPAPPALGSLALSAPEVAEPGVVTFRIGALAPATSDRATATFVNVPVGDVTVEASVGTCPPEALGCGVAGTCPPGCNALSVPVAVTCGAAAQAVVIPLTSPGVPQPAPAPVAPSRPAPGPVPAPVPAPVAPSPEPEPEPEPAPRATRTVKVIAPAATTGVLIKDASGDVQQVNTNGSVTVLTGEVVVQHGYSGPPVVVTVGPASSRIMCATIDACVVK